MAGLAPDGDGPWTWITLAEAADEAGVSRSTLRAWYRDGQVPSQLEPGPHGPQRTVPRELVLERALKARGRLDHDPAPARRPDSVTTVEAILADAARREERLQARIAELEQEVRRLAVQLAIAERDS